MNLARLQKPSRYINHEINAIKKPRSLSRDTVSVALCFPDVYEIGMSHLGLRILYDLINKTPFCAAERVFSPWTDYETHLRDRGLPLTSLESAAPLSTFDVVGFSLQYELSYTTVLNMLSLGDIPLRTEDRMTGNPLHPLVIAGGPCTFNPLPMAPFIDAFLLGDGEEAVGDLLSVIRLWKDEGDGDNGDKVSLLKGIAGIEGFYVPAIHGTTTTIRKRIVSDLSSAPCPEKPVVPYTTIVHDRITIEVSRGCPMGCRFCQAGMIYRPYRQRDPARVIEIAETALKHTGYEEVSFSSLSAGDYPCLLDVITEFNRRFAVSRVAVSLPSLRVGAINREVLRAIRSVRKTGFTIAPEAGSDRLRGVINKDFTGEDFERAVATLFEEGWQHLKLYFMIGLPTETDDDIVAIGDMVRHALSIAKGRRVAGAHITVSVSPFIPKAHTPFQWSGQVSVGDMKKKIATLRKILPRRNVTFKSHDPEMSSLEALFARGDRRHSILLEEAWAAGCRLDGWSDHFSFSKWLDAMDRTGIDGLSDACRTFSTDNAVPWGTIDIGITQDFLLREHCKSLRGERTPSCTHSCGACGLDCKTGQDKETPAQFATRPSGEDETTITRQRPVGSTGPCLRIRVRFSKTGILRHLSHLELTSVVFRALRRGDVPVDFSRGFHPLPRISFGPPLGVGIAGEREYFDMLVFPPFRSADFIDLMNATLPEGVCIRAAAPVPADAPSLASFITRYDYLFETKKPAEGTANGLIYKYRQLFPVKDGLTALGTPLPPVTVSRDDRELDIGVCIEGLAVLNGSAGDDRVRVKTTLRDSDHLKVRIGEIAAILFQDACMDVTITRSAVYGWRNGWSEPL